MAERELPAGASPEPSRAFGGDPVPTTPATPREGSLVIPKKDYRRISVTGEEETRKGLLEAVTVDERGVARNRSAGGVETLLVAVRVNDSQEASVVPFELARDLDGGQIVQLALPADTPSRVGFFLGWADSVEELSAVTRAGLYPGTPLITQGSGEYSPAQEVMLGLRGIKGTEEQERTWADQVGLFTELGFDQGRSRGFFDRASRPDAYTTSWELQPLLMVPRANDADYEHLDRQAVEGSNLQFMYYSTAPQPEVPYIDTAFRGGFGGDNLTFGGATRGATKGGGDLGLAFGRSRLQTGSTTAIDIKSLEGAFRVVATPQA